MADIKNSASTLWGRSPIYVLAFVQALVYALTAFGFGLSGEQVGAIMSLTAAGLALLTNSQIVTSSTVDARVAEAVRNDRIQNGIR